MQVHVVTDPINIRAGTEEVYDKYNINCAHLYFRAGWFLSFERLFTFAMETHKKKPYITSMFVLKMVI